jgi:hypothetical protein
LLPWYAGAMIPLALANVLANDLLARGRFKAVPFMIVLALAYAFTLPYMMNRSPVQPDKFLAAIVGSEAVPQKEVNRKLSDYIRDHDLQDPSDKTRINADEKLKEVFDGRTQVTVSEINDLVLNHVKGDMTIVLKTLGVFNLLLFLVCAVFTWGVKYDDTAATATQGS